ncbi:MAG: lipid-A-disaccharide synthase [Prevotella sp.]|nr:lipid-A-disaccharide synthase [Prevotella sp.]MCM1075478.1 lipid-A-disaccharide synthase [Ruminococcus sp.]
MKYIIIAGEVSGDLHASRLIAAIKKLDKEAEFRFFGGEKMSLEADRAPEVHCDQMNVMGFSEVIRHLPALLGHLRLARRLLQEWRPDALILVDYPSFNLKVAKTASRLGIPVHYFISPKVWAWKEWRVKSIKRYVSSMYSILPFETAFYKKHDYSVKYAGNPSVQEMDEVISHTPSLKHFLQRHGIVDERPIIALIPGSRRGEVKNNLPFMIEAAKRFPDYQIIVGGASSIPSKFYREIAQYPGLNVVFGSTHVLMKHARAALVTSGTATLETALLGTPQVVCYRANGNALSYKIMEKLLKVKYVSLPNLIVDSAIVPELLVHRCTVDSIATHLKPLLTDSPERDRQIAGYKNMRRRLGTSVATDTTAKLIYNSLIYKYESK